MSEFHIEVIRIGAVEKHPNADSLSITQIHGGYPCVFRTGDFHEGDLAVYVPIDAIVPSDDPRFAFLGTHTRIRAAKLRGIFSMGLLVKPDADMVEGEDVRERMRIEKFIPLSEREHEFGPGYIGGPSDNEADPNFMPGYTDIEGLRRWQTALVPGEDVVITEKIHGCNARYIFKDGRLWIGSHHRIKRPDTHNVWTQIAADLELEKRLQEHEGIAIYGEVYGRVQDLKYGTDLSFVMFDAFDTVKKYGWLNHDEMYSLSLSLKIPTAPLLYRGPWDEALRDLRNGDSVLAGQKGVKQIREGIVIRPVPERFDPHNGRVIVKLVGESYLLRKEAA